jgi:hypothetical protein
MSTCCNRMFHAFQMYVVYVSSGCCKSRSGVAYVAMTIHVYCKYMFQMYVASVFIWMLHWLYTYVVSVCFKYLSCFKHMLQVFYLDVAYIAVSTYIYVASVCCT